MSKSILFIAKTDLNTDGRILNELRILGETYPNEVIDFILLPDKPYRLTIKNLRVFSVRCMLRNNRFLRPFTAMEFSIKALLQLFKLSPEIIHIQDSSVIFPVYIYRLIKRKKPVIIYDDHEIPNDFKKSGLRGINLTLEHQMLRVADTVIFANAERQQYLKNMLKLSNHTTYFLNLPYYDEMLQTSSLPQNICNKLEMLDDAIAYGTNYIMHQGVIKEERGAQKLADFSRKLAPNYKILLLGGSRESYKSFVEKFNIDQTAFEFVGTVDYFYLSEFWNRCLASIVLYLPDLLNNRLCAPNRFYLSLQKGLPVIVNRDNPVLSNFIEQYHCGFYIEDLNKDNLDVVLQYDEKKVDFSYDQIRRQQIENFRGIYSRYLS